MRSIVWDITSKCNLRCKHCYNAEKYFNHEVEDLNLSEIKKMFIKLKKENYTKVNILGGEPLFSDHFIAVIELLTEMDFDIMVTSNGILLNSDLIEIILLSNISTFLVSIDGSDSFSNDLVRGNGSFVKATNNLKELISKNEYRDGKMNIGIAFTITKSSINNITGMVDLCKKLNVSNLFVTPLMEAGNAVNDNFNSLKTTSNEILNSIEKMIKYSQQNYPSLSFLIDARPSVIYYLKKKYPINLGYTIGFTRCSFLDGQLYVHSTGEVHPCGLHSLEIGKESQKKGYFNANEAPNIRNLVAFRDAFSSKYFSNFLSSISLLEKKSYHEMCLKCPVKSDCYPCPFQYKGTMYECDWAFLKLGEFEKTVGDWLINKKINIDISKYVEDENYLEVFSSLAEGENLDDSYNNYRKFSDRELSFLDFIDVLIYFEKRFLIKIGREKV